MKTKLNPFISVAIPTWNRFEQVVNAIQSINLKQYDNVEVIVCDNFSSHDIRRKLKLFCSENEQVKYFENDTNIGMTANWNQALKYCRGEWISILCSDDEFSKEGFEKAYKFLKNLKNPSLIIQAPALNSLKHLQPGKESAKIINLPIASGNFLHKECINQCGYFDERLKYSPDAEYWVRVASKSETILFPDTFAKYNIHGDNYMWQTWIKDDIIDQMILISKINQLHKGEIHNISYGSVEWDHYIFFLKNSMGRKKQSQVVKKYLPIVLKKAKTFSKKREVFSLIFYYIFRKLRLKRIFKVR